MLGGLLGLAVGSACWVRSGKAGKLIERARPALRELGEIYGPPLAETLARHASGRKVFAQAAVPPASTTTLAERIARTMAFRSSPVLAEDIARDLTAPGNLRDRTRLVRAELRGCMAFTEISRGRWMLGHSSGYPAAPLPPIEVIEYYERLHKNTIRRRHQAPEH